jgi:hypothetical protein
MKFLTLVLLITTVATSAAVKKQFPRHWGSPPKIQTMDIIPLPGGYGSGSSTLGSWIKRNMDRDQRQPNAVTKQKPFPAHWGPPPRIQTRDYRPLPGGYGSGSSTLGRWIQGNLNRDAQVKATQPKPLYANDLTKEKDGELGDGFLVLDGAFAVKSVNGNKFIELPGAPLGSHGLLFGPTEATNVAVRAKINTTNRKRRYSAFGIGLNGVGGYRLQVTASKRKLELFKQDDVVASVPFRWKPGQWLWTSLQVRKTGNSVWRIEGKVWEASTAAPTAWMISFNDREEPFAGMASIWGQPFAGNPIQFDDLSVWPVK